MKHITILNRKLADQSIVITIIGLGYVGLPLAVEFGKEFSTIGFDINKQRISELENGVDRTLEVTCEQLFESQKLVFTTNVSDLTKSDIFIVAVPTSINDIKSPDLRQLISATSTIGDVLSPGKLIIYESTVYPGCTEEICVPILEEKSGLKFNTDFYCGYSPSRINSGDKEHTITKIRKITSGSTSEITQVVDNLYASIITAGTHKVSSIKVAEAAKIIENTQRDINIAFINELSILFEKLNISTHEVLEAAGTDSGFFPFRPGLVGGHRITVDPYYLSYKAKSAGYHPEMILSGRRINNDMGKEIANRVVKRMIHQGTDINTATVLILGFTCKENCPDIRNTRIVDVIQELNEFECNVTVFDPLADKNEVRQEYGISILSNLNEIECKFSAIVLCVGHQEILNINMDLYLKDDGIIFDVTGSFTKTKKKKINRL